jgi:peptide/nickel transport system permease protein
MRYVLRNGSISGVSILGINVGALAGGSLVVENVFALPGMGTAMMQGILNRDFPVVQVSTLVFAAIVILVYLLTDLAYALLDPRVRLA